MGKRTQTLDRGRLEKKCYGQTNLSLRCLDHKEEHSWDAEQVKRCWRSAWRHLSSMEEVMWLVCGCFDAGKVGDLCKVKGILNKEGYHSILQCHAIPCGQRLIGANFLLQQDNDPKHTSKLFNNYLGKKESAGILSVMKWPAQSPDLNPIELFWEQLVRIVCKKCPSSQSNLWEVLKEAWGEISSDYLNKLTARMPKVCKAVIAANGEFFDKS